MSLHNENREELQTRKEGLEYTAMMMAVEGFPIPEDLANELMQVQAQLSELGDAAAPLRTWTSWLGHTVEGFNLRERISHGTYSHLFRAVHEKTGEECAIKLATTNAPVSINTSSYFSKQAISFQMELCQPLALSPNTVLDLECQRLKNDSSGYFVKVLSSGFTDDCFYYRMPFLVGQSLKELMALPDMPLLEYIIEIFRRLCTVLESLSSAASGYHGNLQADSIFVSKTDVVLLSPGCFDVSDASYSGAPFMVTTPAYYPFFDKNDLFALALTFWELVCKQHPLSVANLLERPQLFASDLREMLDYRKSLNHDPLWQFLKLRLPRDIRNDLSDETELFMMKAIKLAFQSDGCVTGDPGFANPAEFSLAMEKLAKHGLLRHK
jgi:serine/threonine protein kinase